MKRVCIGIHYCSHFDGLKKTVARLRSNTPRNAALLLLADGLDPVASLELRALPDVLQLSTAAREGPAACFNRFAAASPVEALVFVESGTLVPQDWLDSMLAPMCTDAKIGLVLTGTGEENSLIVVAREVVRAVGQAEVRRPWIPEYISKVRAAGFGVVSVDLETENTQVAIRERPVQTFGHRPDSRAAAAQEANGHRQEKKVSREFGGLNIAGHFNISSGYGSMSEYLVRGVSRSGAQVSVIPMSMNPDGLSREFSDLLHRSRKRLTDPLLYYSWPEPALQRFFGYPELFIYTMCESSRLPEGWAEQINRARAVIVPTKFVANAFRESGVTIPIEIVPDGVDPGVYYLVDRPIGAGLTTLTVGPIDNRKNVRTGIAAWKEAFADDPDARLVIKTQYNYQNYVPDDSRIRYVDVVENTRGILHWYRQADVLLALGSEGFGLPLIEGMATGLPVIALNSEGQSDVCQDACGLLLPVPAAAKEIHYSHSGPCGVHGVPAVADVAARLQWVATHRDEAREMGRAASRWVLEHRDVWAKGPAVLDVIERYSHSPLPFRRSTVFWVPSWQSQCGIAEYTAYLRECLPNSVKVAAREPDLRALRLLHIQHESGIFEQSQVLNFATKATNAGIPLVVTEHTVDDHTRGWEQHGTALVALNTLGVARLKARWPGKRVEYIPHGCPTWFPPRKTSRAKVIGAFGFLGFHKGFWHLLDILRQLPGTELLLFASTRSSEIEALWESASEGLPVRRIREYLPVAEVAHRLAAEADILAYWYDDVPHYSASGAVRIGLATGVPVLASQTSWFHDLRTVTHQPASLVEGVRRLMEDTDLRSDLTARACQYCHENSWSAVATQHLALWKSLA
jgi:glycosyltransferase involved in cell wall biosynthesis